MYGHATGSRPCSIIGSDLRPRSDRQGIRSVARGTFPPVTFGVTENEDHVYLFAPD